MNLLAKYRRYRALSLMASDAALIAIAILAAYWVRYIGEWIAPVDEANYVAFSEYAPSAAFLTLLLVIIYRAEGLYTPQRGLSWLDRVATIVRGTLVGVVALSFIFFFYRPAFYSRLMFGLMGVFIVIVLSLARLVLGMLLARLRRRGLGVDRLIIVGAGERSRALMRAIVARPELGYRIVGFLDDDPAGPATIGRFPALGVIDSLPAVLDAEGPDEVIVALPATDHQRILNVLDEAERRHIRVKVVPDLYELTLNRVAVDDINGIPLIGVREPTISGWNYALKRAIDILLSLVVLAILSPIFAAIALAIKLDSTGPVLFAQPRVGRAGRIFTCFKFRSMRLGADDELDKLMEQNEATGQLFKIKNDPRRTRVGSFIRRTSLDEFPQIINVLRGEMSWVGPRPPLPREVAQYEEWHKRRLEVAPGITGLWQVSGRSQLSFDEMVMLDLYYIENWSLALDLVIILRTVPSVLLAQGAY
ncbi:MAG: sugar transferase [Chloroflexi bacterium]|nr:sugar transferase [Chloroflexota bacterium]